MLENNKQQDSIIVKLLNYFKEAIEAIKEMDFMEAYEYMHEKKIHFGLCYAADKIFGIDIYYEDFIRDNKPADLLYWYRIPESARTVSQIIDRLQYRVNLLQKLSETI